jgi:tetratricopeptide (TPR) repeat protein
MLPRTSIKLAVLFAAVVPILALPQEIAGTEAPSIEEIRSILHIASALVPQIEKTQQGSVASNIAAQQARLGDPNEGLATINEVQDQQSRQFATRFFASNVARFGDENRARSLVENSVPGNGADKAQAYSLVAQALVERKSLNEALNLADRIQNCDDFFGKINVLVQTLMTIRSAQHKADDLVGADVTLNLALNAVEREAEHPFEGTFAQSMPAGAYQTIAMELAKEGYRSEALRIIERIYRLIAEAPDQKHRQDTIFTLGNAWASLGELEAAREVAEQLVPGQQREGVLMVIADKQATDSEPLDALPQAMALTYEPWRIGSLRLIADSLAASGNYMQALSTIDLIDDAGERAYGFSEVAYEQARKNDPSASAFLQLAWDAARKAGNETQPFVFGQIAVGRGMTGDIAGALEVLDRMAERDRWWAVESLSAILVHAGREPEAIALAEGQQTAYPKATAYLGIASQLIAERDAASRRRHEAHR